MTTRMMIDLSEERAREEHAIAAAAVKAAHARTQYAIKLTSCDRYVGANMRWVEREDALPFDFMTSAIAYAIDMGYTLDAFTVEAI